MIILLSIKNLFHNTHSLWLSGNLPPALSLLYKGCSPAINGRELIIQIFHQMIMISRLEVFTYLTYKAHYHLFSRAQYGDPAGVMTSGQLL